MAAGPALLAQIGHARFDAASPELEAAIERQNQTARIVGLSDTLNPAIIDAAKARALVKALAPDSVQKLGGKALLLSPAALRIGTSAPTTPSSFTAPVTLTDTEVHGGAVLAKASVPIDCALARKQSGAARLAFDAAEQDVTRREAAKPADNAGLVALSDARSGRFAIATVWKENAAAALACAPDDAAAKQDLDKATSSAKRTIQAPRSGMPAD